jgi:biotin carboxylase
MKQKKLLLLGGLRYLIPVIKAAQEIDIYVITCDYIPNNIAHKFSDEYHNVNIINKEAVLNLAKLLKIDGIMSFAVDPGVVTAAYVANELGLPSIPYKSAIILQNKGLFREFLKKHNFNVPVAKSYSKDNFSLDELTQFNWPIIVKPVDSAGSKGVTKVDKNDEIESAINDALLHSFSGKFIIEDFIEKKGFSSDSDCFSVNGIMKFYSFNNQRFNKSAANPYTPSAYSWPSTISEKNQLELKVELQRLVNLLDLGTSIYNVEVREGVNGKAYIMEMAPRGGGNRLSELVKHATSVDLIKNAVKAAIGIDDLDISQKDYEGYWAEVILHAPQKGYFQKVVIDESFNKKHIVELDLWVKDGDIVNEFNGANDAIGTLILKFDSQNQLENMMNCQESWLNIIVN